MLGPVGSLGLFAAQRSTQQRNARRPLSLPLRAACSTLDKCNFIVDTWPSVRTDSINKLWGIEFHKFSIELLKRTLSMSVPESFGKHCAKPTKLAWSGTITTPDGKVTTQKDAILPSWSPIARLGATHGCVGSSVKTDATITHMGKKLTINGTLTAL